MARGMGGSWEAGPRLRWRRGPSIEYQRSMARDRSSLPPAPVGGRDAWWALGLLVLVYALNFLDRQIPSILAERIKADLGVTDAQMGFLYGTAFAVFYAVFGIPLGRLADTWVRTRMIAVGLGFWSAMTALSGCARSFGELAVARIGVGVGEASAAPAAYSLLSDYFPERRRATVLAIYQSGIHLGSGLGLALGGVVVARWEQAWQGGVAPWGLRGWQAAFLVAGLPGLLLALAVRGLREPVRGQADGIPTPPEAHPFRAAGRELTAVLPPLAPFHLWNTGAGPRAVMANLLAAGTCAALALLLTDWLGNGMQWTCLAVGLHAAVSWMQALGHRDPVSATLMLRTPSLRWAVLAFAALAASLYGLNFWTAPFFVRVHHVPEAEAGPALGLIHALAGATGTTIGGVLADRWRQRRPEGRLLVALLSALLPAPLALLMFTTPSVKFAYACYVPLAFANGLWAGPAVSTIQDLVLPRMRGVASAAYLLIVTLCGLALGPYMIGRLSVAFGDLRHALCWGVAGYGLALGGGLLALRTLAADERTKLARAAAAGEAGLAV